MVTGLTVVLDGKGAAASNLSGFAVFLVVFALSSPLSEILSAVNMDKWDLVLLGKSFDELLVFWIIAIVGKNDEIGILSVEGLTNLVKSFNESYSISVRLEIWYF